MLGRPKARHERVVNGKRIFAGRGAGRSSTMGPILPLLQKPKEFSITGQEAQLKRATAAHREVLGKMYGELKGFSPDLVVVPEVADIEICRTKSKEGRIERQVLVNPKFLNLGEHAQKYKLARMAVLAEEAERQSKASSAVRIGAAVVREWAEIAVWGALLPVIPAAPLLVAGYLLSAKVRSTLAFRKEERRINAEVFRRMGATLPVEQVKAEVEPGFWARTFPGLISSPDRELQRFTAV